jgi:hypothetical protein
MIMDITSVYLYDLNEVTNTFNIHSPKKSNLPFSFSQLGYESASLITEIHNAL